MRETLHDYCVRTGDDTLLRQWDEARNGSMTPCSISYGSKKKVWWRCDRGHIWEANVTSRTCGGSGCPYCAGKKAISGKNDLAACYPQLAAQWHSTRNGSLTPQDVLPGSSRKVWWCCPKGHEWQARIKSRVSGCDCPVCTNRTLRPGENDLASCFPELAKQWHPVHNGNLTPADVLPGSHRRVWWLCAKGHVWRAQVSARVAGSGCPVCAGKQVAPGQNDLATQRPELAKQWHPTRNGALTPQKVLSCSNRKVWWVCELGHAYQAAISARVVQSSGCPYCAGRRVWPGFNDLATLEPELAEQWHPTLNGKLTPQMVTVGSHRKVWWCCDLGHVWKAVIYSRTGERRSGCPICAGNSKKSRRNTGNILCEK